MKFVCIGYLDESKWSQLASDEQEKIISDYAHFYADLKQSGHFQFGYGLTDVSQGVRVEMRDGLSDFSHIPNSGEQLGGVFLLEAKDLDEAKTLISRHPGLILGSFDIRPVDEALTEAVGA